MPSTPRTAKSSISAPAPLGATADASVRVAGRKKSPPLGTASITSSSAPVPKAKKRTLKTVPGATALNPLSQMDALTHPDSGIHDLATEHLITPTTPITPRDAPANVVPGAQNGYAPCVAAPSALDGFAQHPIDWFCSHTLGCGTHTLSLMLKKRIEQFFYTALTKTQSMIVLTDSAFIPLLHSVYRTLDPAGAKDAQTQQALTLYATQLQWLALQTQLAPTLNPTASNVPCSTDLAPTSTLLAPSCQKATSAPAPPHTGSQHASMDTYSAPEPSSPSTHGSVCISGALPVVGARVVRAPLTVKPNTTARR